MLTSDLENYSEIRRQVTGAAHILLATHLKPDGDAIGSTLGLAAFLREHGIRHTVLLPDGVPELYRLTAAEYLTTPPADFGTFDLIMLLDTAVPKRAGFSQAGGVPEAIRERLLVIDHHHDNPRFGHWNYVAPRAATSEIIFGLCESFGAAVPRETADWLLMGLLTDTGGFRFDNTDAVALQAGARLLEAGANLNKVVNAIYFSKPYKQQLFESELLSGYLHWACDKRMVWAVITPELLNKYDFDLSNAEGVIDVLRAIAGTEIVGLISQRGDNGCRISLRSKNPARPVVEFAHRHHGGGHAMAAGMTLETKDLNEASAVLEREAPSLFPEGAPGGILQS